MAPWGSGCAWYWQHRATGRRAPALERRCEWAGGHPLSDLSCMPGVVEQVGVDARRDRRTAVSEDSAHLRHIEPEVDDQMAGEDMAKVVKAKWRPGLVLEPSEVCGACQAASCDVSMPVGRAVRGSEHPVGSGGERRRELVSGEQRRELGDERDVADRRGGLRGHAPSWLAAVGAGELRANVDHAGGKVDVTPDQPEQLGDPP